MTRAAADRRLELVEREQDGPGGAAALERLQGAHVHQHRPAGLHVGVGGLDVDAGDPVLVARGRRAGLAGLPAPADAHGAAGGEQRGRGGEQQVASFHRP